MRLIGPSPKVPRGLYAPHSSLVLRVPRGLIAPHSSLVLRVPRGLSAQSSLLLLMEAEKPLCREIPLNVCGSLPVCAVASLCVR